MPDQSNRVKVLYISDDYVLQAIAGMYGRQPQVLHMLKLPIPDGARVLRCHADWSRRAVGFLVEHESFPEVPAGVAPPDMLIDDDCDAEIVSIPWAEDGKLPPSYEALQARVKELQAEAERLRFRCEWMLHNGGLFNEFAREQSPVGVSLLDHVRRRIDEEEALAWRSQSPLYSTLRAEAQSPPVRPDRPPSHCAAAGRDSARRSASLASPTAGDRRRPPRSR